MPPKRRRLEGIVPHRGGEWQAILNNESGPPTVAEVLELLGDDIRDPREFFNNPERQEPGEFYGLNCLQQLFEEFPNFSKKFIGKVFRDNNRLFVPAAGALKVYQCMAATDPELQQHIEAEPRERFPIDSDFPIDPGFAREYLYWRIESEVNQHFREAGRSRSPSPRAKGYRKEDDPYHPKNLYGDVQTDNHQIDSPKGGVKPSPALPAPRLLRFGGRGGAEQRAWRFS